MNDVVHGAARRRSLGLTAVIGAVALVLAGCSSGGSTPSAADASKVAAPILSTLSGAERTRVAKLIAQARTEGGLHWMDSVVADTTEATMIASFKRLYGLPDLKVKFDRVMTGDIASQIPQQVQARKVTTDLVGTASPQLFSTLKQAGALLKYTPAGASAYADAAQYISEDPGYWISPAAYAFEPISAPSHYAAKITSWQDLLAPALKGHISIGDARSSQAQLYNYIAMRKILPLSWFQQLAAQDPQLSTGGSIQDTQQISSGEILASLTSGFRALQTVAQTKVPISVDYPSEGVIMIGQTYSVLAGSPDPATAELFEDYLVSTRGLQQLVNLEGVTPARTGITLSADVRKYSPASLAAVKVIPMDYSTISDAQLKSALAEWTKVFVK